MTTKKKVQAKKKTSKRAKRGKPNLPATIREYLAHRKGRLYTLAEIRKGISNKVDTEPKFISSVLTRMVIKNEAVKRDFATPDGRVLKAYQLVSKRKSKARVKKMRKANVAAPTVTTPAA